MSKENCKAMVETDRYSKNEFNPMFNRIVSGNRLANKKLHEPFRIRTDADKYRYVVDWQIEEDLKPVKKPEDFW